MKIINTLPSCPQSWVDEVRELGQFYDPLAAQLEVEAVDVRGGRDEARLEVVYRQLRDLFRQQMG